MPDLNVLGDLKPDVVVECTGASPVVVDVVARTGALGIVCLAGVSSGGYKIDLDIGSLNRELVLENDAIFGSVNANRGHYEMAAQALARADRGWLTRLISRRVPIDRWQDAMHHEVDDVKVVITF
jgi:threonine dehydrogenase-like Zn-dependent dehydrogenase